MRLISIAGAASTLISKTIFRAGCGAWNDVFSKNSTSAGRHRSLSPLAVPRRQAESGIRTITVTIHMFRALTRHFRAIQVPGGFFQFCGGFGVGDWAKWPSTFRSTAASTPAAQGPGFRINFAGAMDAPTPFCPQGFQPPTLRPGRNPSTTSCVGISVILAGEF